MAHTTTDEQRGVLLDQAATILRASDESVQEESDRSDVRQHCDRVRLAESGAAEAETLFEPST
jgi:hypothetical protein